MENPRLCFVDFDRFDMNWLLIFEMLFNKVRFSLHCRSSIVLPMKIREKLQRKLYFCNCWDYKQMVEIMLSMASQ